MTPGQTILCKHNGQIIECVVIDLLENDIILDYRGERLVRKYWEVKRYVPTTEE